MRGEPPWEPKQYKIWCKMRIRVLIMSALAMLFWENAAADSWEEQRTPVPTYLWDRHAPRAFYWRKTPLPFSPTTTSTLIRLSGCWYRTGSYLLYWILQLHYLCLKLRLPLSLKSYLLSWLIHSLSYEFFYFPVFVWSSFFMALPLI